MAEKGDGSSWNTLRGNYIRLLRSRKGSEIDLWPSQLEAANRAIDMTDDLIVALPTSAGKTKIAEMCILRCLASNKRVIYRRRRKLVESCGGPP